MREKEADQSETDQRCPRSTSLRALLLRVFIWWLAIDLGIVCDWPEIVLGTVCDSLGMVLGTVCDWFCWLRGRPGPLLVVLRRGSDGWWVAGCSGFLMKPLMRLS